MTVLILVMALVGFVVFDIALLVLCGLLALRADEHRRAAARRLRRQKALAAVSRNIERRQATDVLTEMWGRPSHFIDQDDPEFRTWSA